MRWSRKDKVNAALNSVLAVAATLALVFSWKACRQSDDAHRLAMDANTIANDANKLVVAANAIAQKSYDLALHNAQPDFLLETEPLGLGLKPGPLKIVARVKNVGPTTAFRVVTVGRIDVPNLKQKPIDLSALAFHISAKSNTDVEPQHSASVVFGPAVELTAEDIKKLRAGTATLSFDVTVQSDPVAGITSNPANRQPRVFTRTYDRSSGDWIRAFPGGNPAFDTR